MDLWIGAINLGILFAFMAIGTFITYKLYSFPDITIDGTFTTGAAVGSILIVNGWNPFLVLPVAFLVGSLAGFITGFIHTRFKIEGLLAGILVMTGLYSVNLHIMGKSNIPLLNSPTFITILSELNPGMDMEVWTFVFLMLVILCFWILISLFLKTDFGLTMRSTGNNPVMVAAQGISVDHFKIFGIAFANGLVGISGALVAQYQGFADIGMGIGSIIFSLAAVIIGDALFRGRSMFVMVFGVIVGSVIFRLAVALALYMGMNPNDLKIITAFFVLLTIVATKATQLKFNKRILRWVGFTCLLLLITFFIVKYYSTPSMENKKIKIGLLLANQSSLMTNTRNGFYDEMKKLGYHPGENCEIIELNAEGDIPTNRSMIDHLLTENVDIFVTVSTASTQAAIQKVKEKPIVFATVANPFVIETGKNDSIHLPNVTGVYGSAPVKELLQFFTSLFPGPRKIGTIYNPAFPNTKVNLGELEKALTFFPQLSLEQVAVAGTSEVYQAAQALGEKDIKAFILINDLTVFNALESIVKISRSKKIPIFSNDAERLQDGVLLVYGYEYYVSGMQAAHLVDRILKGEKPAGIPFEKYKIISCGVNYDVAKTLGINIPESIREQAKINVLNGQLTKPPLTLENLENNQGILHIALFQINNNSLLDRTVQGFREEINKQTVISGKRLVFDEYNAHGDYGTGQTIAKQLVSKNYDYIITFSTLAAQMVANSNKKIPHVFCAVTDPVRAGVVKSFLNHPAYITGLATPQPVEATVSLMRQFLPKARRIGIIWNTGEINSEICTEKARQASKKFGFQLIEKAITSLNDLDDAVNSLTGSGIDVFFISGDVMISQVIPRLAETMKQKNIPFFTNTADDINAGSFVSLGADYYDVGTHTGTLFERLVTGTDPRLVAVENYVPTAFSINLKLAKKYGIVVPDSILEKAKTIIR